MQKSADIVPLAFGRFTQWRGRSGKAYDLSADRLDSFTVSGSDLYLIVHGDHVGWVGSEQDLIHDQASRARFLIAMHGATGVFHLPAPRDDVERMTLTWDLEGGTPMGILSAA